jgi:pimeloyl-ACP methyl ester carboxylesterase
MPIVERNGRRFHVQELGTSGPPVVLVHGLLETLATWYFTAAPELARTHRVLLFDQRGHGRSDPARSGYDLDSLTGDLAAHVDAFADGEPASVVGSSLGGAVALRYALDRPGRVERLVLVEAPLPLVSSPELGWLAEAGEDELLEILPAAHRRGLTPGGRRLDRLTRQARTLTSETTLIDDLLAQPDIPDDELRQLRVPVLLCYGVRSHCRPARDRLLRALPDARPVDLPAGHFVALEVSAELTAAVTEFLDG